MAWNVQGIDWRLGIEQKPEQEVDITIGLPSMGSCSVAWAVHLAQLYENIRFMQTGMPNEVIPRRVQWLVMSGQPVDDARERICEEAWGKHILFLDCDVFPPLNAVPKLLKDDREIVSGWYARRSNPPVPGLYKYRDNSLTEWGVGGHTPYLDWNRGDIVDVDAIGAGCLLIKKECLKKIPKPWFYFGKVKNNDMCVLPGQNVLGGSKIEDVNMAETIFSGEGNERNVAAVFERPYKGQKVTILPKCLRLQTEVTENHKILVLRDGKEEMVFASELNKETDCVGFPQIQTWRHRDEIDLLMEIGGEIINNRLHTKDAHRRGLGIPQLLPLTDDVLFTLGWFVAEGGTTWNGASYTIAFAAHETKEAERVNRTLENIFGVHTSRQKRVDYFQIQGTNRTLVRLFKHWFGENAQTKKIPNWVFSLDAEQLTQFLAALWRGDGFVTYSGIYHNTVFGLNTASKELAIGIAAILIKFGIRPTIREYVQPKEAFGAGNKVYHVKVYHDAHKMEELLGIESPYGYQLRQRDHSQSVIGNGKFWTPIDEIKIEKWQGTVHNIEVEEDHNYIVNTITVGNSEDFYLVHKAKDAGVLTYVDTEVACGHLLPFLVQPNTQPGQDIRQLQMLCLDM